MAEFFSSAEERRVDDILAQDLLYWIGLSDAASEGKDIKNNVKNTEIERIKWWIRILVCFN